MEQRWFKPTMAWSILLTHKFNTINKFFVSLNFEAICNTELVTGTNSLSIFASESCLTLTPKSFRIPTLSCSGSFPDPVLTSEIYFLDPSSYLYTANLVKYVSMLSIFRSFSQDHNSLRASLLRTKFFFFFPKD